MKQDDMKFFQLYGAFLKDIVNQKNEAKLMLKKFDELKQKLRFQNTKITKNVLKNKYA